MSSSKPPTVPTLQPSVPASVSLSPNVASTASVQSPTAGRSSIMSGSMDAEERKEAAGGDEFIDIKVPYYWVVTQTSCNPDF